MELVEVQRAVETLQAQGIPLAAITSVMVREILGTGSYTTITAHLRAIRGEVPAEDAPVDLVGEAEQRLQAARQRALDLETAIPEHEHRIEQARQQVIKAVNLKLVAREADYRSYLPSDDPLLQTIGQQVEEAAQHLRSLRAEREDLSRAIAQARQSITACEQAVTQARRQAFLAAHHPELIEQLAALTRDNPAHTGDSMSPGYYSRQAQWHKPRHNFPYTGGE